MNTLRPATTYSTPDWSGFDSNIVNGRHIPQPSPSPRATHGMEQASPNTKFKPDAFSGFKGSVRKGFSAIGGLLSADLAAAGGIISEISGFLSGMVKGNVFAENIFQLYSNMVGKVNDYFRAALDGGKPKGQTFAQGVVINEVLTGHSHAEALHL